VTTTLHEDLRGCIQSGEALFVIGAGVSAASTTQPVATWRGLLRHGVDRALELGRLDGEPSEIRSLVDSFDLDDLLRVADAVTLALGGRTGGEYSRWLRDTVGSLRPEDDTLLSVIAGSQIPLATTNYDALLEGATGLEATTWQQPSVFQRVIRGDERAVLHLHGFWRNPESVVLGSASYGDVVSDPFASSALRAVALMRNLVFVGFGAGFEDPNFNGLRLWMREVLAGSEYRHFRLVRSGDLDDALALHSVEERIVPIVFGDNHEDLPEFLRSLGRAPIVAAVVAQPPVQEAVAAERSLTRSRIVQRFLTLGLAVTLAEEFADDPSIGPPPDDVGGAGVRLIVGEAGSGKSTSADRLYMHQIALFESGNDRRVPVYLRGRDVAPGELTTRVGDGTQLGIVESDGVYVIIDGADEPGPSTTRGLLEDSVELCQAWPSSSVTIFSREYETADQGESEVPWETRWMSRLSDDQIAHLRSRLGATQDDPWPWRGRWDREASLPVFVIIVTQYMRHSPADLSKQDAIALVRDEIVNEAVAQSDVDPSFFEQLAADWIRSSGEVTVRDVAPTYELKSAVSRCRVLAVDARGYLSFRIPEVAWSLAAQYLERDVDRFDEIIEDPIARHQWMPAVDVVLAAGDVDAGNELMHKLVRHAPGLALPRVPGLQMVEGDLETDFLAEAQRIERAMKSWVNGIGPLKGLAVPHVGDQYPEFRAIADMSGVSAAWRGLSRARVHHINRPYLGRHWEWAASSGDLTARLSEVLRFGLPPTTTIARNEAEYVLATRVTSAPRVPSRARRIDLGELEAAASGDLPNVALMRPEMVSAARAVARTLVARLQERSEASIEPPWPPGDDPSRMGWVWDGWSIDGLLERGGQVSRAALDIYREIVDRWFPNFTQELRLSFLWPVRLVAFAEFNSENCPMISWTFEPLAIGTEVEVDWRQGTLGYLQFPGDSTTAVVHRRSDLKGRYFHSVYHGNLGLFELDAATATAMHWLHSDLQSLRWVRGGPHQTPMQSTLELITRANVALNGLVLPPL
jgi:hypothetical protein